MASQLWQGYPFLSLRHGIILGGLSLSHPHTHTHALAAARVDGELALLFGRDGVGVVRAPRPRWAVSGTGSWVCLALHIPRPADAHTSGVGCAGHVVSGIPSLSHVAPHSWGGPGINTIYAILRVCIQSRI